MTTLRIIHPESSCGWGGRELRIIGARYLLLIALNKESICAEHLPAWIGPKLGPSRLDQLIAYLGSNLR
jgi:hypothetical protein